MFGNTDAVIKELKNDYKTTEERYGKSFVDEAVKEKFGDKRPWRINSSGKNELKALINSMVFEARQTQIAAQRAFARQEAQQRQRLQQQMHRELLARFSAQPQKEEGLSTATKVAIGVGSAALLTVGVSFIPGVAPAITQFVCSKLPSVFDKWCS